MSGVPARTNFDGPRSARPEEMKAIVDLLDTTHRTSQGKPPSIATDWPHIYNEANAQNVIIMKDGDRFICSTGIWINDVQLGDTRLRVGGINCVATVPELRKHGLGKIIMDAAHQRMKEAGCHVGLLNTAIVSWYRRLGWEESGCAISYRFTKSNIGLLPALPPDTTMRVAGLPADMSPVASAKVEASAKVGDEALESIIRIRNADKLGGIRTPDLLRVLLQARGKPKIVIAERGGQPVAYLFSSGRSIREWGGPANVVAGLVRAWYESCESPDLSTSQRNEDWTAVIQDEMSFTAPCWGHSLLKRLEQQRFPFTIGYLGMMIVLDPRGTLDAFGLGDIAIAPQGDQFVLSRRDKKCSVTQGQLATLFFGPERITDFGEDVFPLPFWQWGIERV